MKIVQKYMPENKTFVANLPRISMCNKSRNSEIKTIAAIQFTDSAQTHSISKLKALI
jgi:hypothetical protein